MSPTGKALKTNNHNDGIALCMQHMRVCLPGFLQYTAVHKSTHPFILCHSICDIMQMCHKLMICADYVWSGNNNV